LGSIFCTTFADLQKNFSKMKNEYKILTCKGSYPEFSRILKTVFLEFKKLFLNIWWDLKMRGGAENQ
tara:strand:- start:323 stop:523 length:201 start_codon:yes stop_codon:yes gene_type:complete